MRGNGFLGRFQAFDSTGKSLGLDGPFHLRKGNHRIGIAIYDREGKWVGFKWVRLISEAEGVLLPLTLDNIWKYDMTGFNESGGLIATHTLQSTVIGYRTISGDRYSELESRIDADAPSSNFCLNKFSGLWIVNAQGTPELVYKYPANSGDSYLLTLGISVSVDSVGTTRTVPAGTFDNCFVYTFRYGGIPHTTVRTLAVDVGEIQTREYDKGSGGAMYLSSVSQLRSYTLK